MEWVETTGNNVQQAKDAALDQLGVDEVDAEFEVVAEERHGLFGRLRSEARVRARVRPTAPPAKVDRRDRRRKRPSGSSTSSRSGNSRSSGNSNGNGHGSGDKAKSTDSDDSDDSDDSGGGSGRGGGSGGGGKSQGKASTDGTQPNGTAGGQRSNNKRRRNRNGSRRSGTGSPAKDTAAAAESGATVSAAVTDTTVNSGDGASGSAQRSKGKEENHVEVALEEQGQVAEKFLKGLVERMGIHARVRSHARDEDTVELFVEGDDLGVLIGVRGNTILALQDLTRTVVARQTGANNGRLLVDVGGYRAKRQVALARFAEQVARQVKQSGSRKVLEPMNSADRKVVHDTINEIDGVTTTSQGDDPRRYVVVMPS